MARTEFDPPGDPGEPGPAPSNGDLLLFLANAGRSALDRVTFLAGYAVALGCRHREPALPAGSRPMPEYKGSVCGMDPQGGPCAPARCPLALQGVSAVLWGGATGFLRSWWGRGARPDGVSSDDRNKGQPGP